MANVACDVGANNVRVASYADMEYRLPRRKWHVNKKYSDTDTKNGVLVSENNHLFLNIRKFMEIAIIKTSHKIPDFLFKTLIWKY